MNTSTITKGNGRIWAVAFLLISVLAGTRVSAHSTADAVPGRCMWVVRFALTDFAAVRRIVDRAFMNGFTTLLVQVRGRGDAWYSDGLEPLPAALKGGNFDPLAYLIEYAAYFDIEIHAWINTLLVWNRNGLPGDGTHVFSRHPEWMMHDRRGRSLATYTRPMFDKRLLEGVFISPALPEVREYTLALVRDLLTRYRLDGIHLDYVRYPSPEFDFHPQVVELFKEQHGFNPAGAISTAQAAEWQAWRLEQLTGLVRRIRAECNRIAPRAMLSAAVKPDPDEARERFGQDWGGWCREGLLDAVMPMSYTENANLFREWSETAVKTAGSVPVYMGIGAYKQPAFAACQKVWSTMLRGDMGGISVFSYNYAAREDGYLSAFSRGPFAE